MKYQRNYKDLSLFARFKFVFIHVLLIISYSLLKDTRVATGSN